MAKRRPSGDGMVRRRDDGRWEGRIVVGHKKNGEPIFHYMSAKTQMVIYNKDRGFQYLRERRLHTMKKQPDREKITALYERLFHDDGRTDESVSIENQELICKGWIHRLIHMTAAHLW